MGTATTRGAGASALRTYLNDHLAGLVGAAELGKRAASANPELTALAEDLERDRDALVRIMTRLRVPVRRHKVAGAWLAEKAGRAKLNGRLLSRSPLSDVVELDGLLTALSTKSALWRSLRALKGRLGVDETELEELLHRAGEQVLDVERRRVEAVVRVL
ncbi:hypothetical protein KCV87_31355 [Actinosynnema pretiosum subsp. pretiosum]|uniref:Uncharacterized protein n=2 Tax=Actinosynnema TaxID=40566 RepID=C6WPD2_ACTMD|nr:hypothetical protein [Actinosynnema mirum]ACU38634.1 conserved hypothetical protein [Actinosynnema mirum DSM 43827]AXX32235.1 hypothetical protein APASM_4870 [Actinosynnema pretiosum subsp. pretiosum]QUF03814.1 hypothetical protein KCV87_31355 [Actinosynnema pretiosum subsp. pretiosum]